MRILPSHIYEKLLSGARRAFAKASILRVVVVLIVVAVLFVVSRPFLSTVSHNIRTRLSWAPLIFNAPEKMEPTPFWHCGENCECLSADHLIAHAGAAIEQTTYTNSLEALESARRAGFKFVEIDLRVLPDGTIVGRHDDIHSSFAPKTWEEFSVHLIAEKFTPLSLPMIREFFHNNPDMWLVTDKICEKGDLEKFLANWGGVARNRLIVEVFSPQQWLDARELGIRYPALNVSSGWQLRALRHFNIPAATCDVDVMKKYPRETEEYLKAGGSLLVCTLNDAFVAKQNISRHATLFYTDYLTPAATTNPSHAADRH